MSRSPLSDIEGGGRRKVGHNFHDWIPKARARLVDESSSLPSSSFDSDIEGPPPGKGQGKGGKKGGKGKGAGGGPGGGTEAG